MLAAVESGTIHPRELESMKIVFAGAYAAGLQALRAIADLGCEVTAVLTLEKQATTGSTVADFARKKGYVVKPGKEVKNPEFAEYLKNWEVDLFVNVLSPFQVCSEVLNAPRIGAFNLHPSLLPRHAGLNPLAWALYYGDLSHGVTLHWMDATLDTGAIAWQQQFPIASNDNAVTMLAACVRSGIPMIRDLIRVAASDPGLIPRVGQDISLRSYHGPEAPGGQKIDWALPAQGIHRMMRAYDYAPLRPPWGYPIASLQNGRVEISGVRLTGEPCGGHSPGSVQLRSLAPGQVAVATADEWVIVTFSEYGSPSGGGKE